MDEEYLDHSGVKGQKWGYRRYQNSDGSLTAEGRKHYGVGPPRKATEKTLQNLAKSAQKKREAVKAKRAEKKAEKEIEDKKEHHESMKRYVRSHPQKLYKHRFEFSDDEIKTLVSQIDTDTKIKDISVKASERNWQRVERLSNRLGSLYKLGSNAKGLYNLAADVNNFMIDNETMSGKKWTKIGEK